MCGIIAYKGKKNAVPIIVGGLKKLEYRGYDSVGLSVIHKKNQQIFTYKQSGSIDDLNVPKKLNSNIGIGHTRWATHGKACRRNAHPHVDVFNTLAIVHNGILENHKEIRKSFNNKYTIHSDTDTEVLLYMIYEIFMDIGDLYASVKIAVEKIIGAYSFVLLDQSNPNQLICAKKGSPLSIGLGDTGEYFISSDPVGFSDYTNTMIHLKDGCVVKISDDDMQHYDSNVKEVTQCNVEKIYNNTYEINKGTYSSYMLKEIFEQPKSVSDCLLGRVSGYKVKLGGLDDYSMHFKRSKRIILLGCGSSWHSALLGKYYIEEIAGVAVNIEYASEFRYRKPYIEKEDIVIGISQSGETADTIAALNYAKDHGALTIGICNTVGSEIARMTDAGIYTRCGVEVGVASTKAYTNQCLSMLMLALWIDQKNGYYDLEKRKKIINSMNDLPILLTECLANSSDSRDVADKFQSAKNCLFLGRSHNYPVALEGALKLKEISYIHAEGYPAAEMKHGPIALVDKNMPVVVLANGQIRYEKIISNKTEVESRGAKTIAVINSLNNDKVGKYNIKVPVCDEHIVPFMSIIPLQLFSLYCAEARGCNVDKPRNLAKSVTVE
jgi:glucosamine--fructose-6-phosphate aminotransferase (isomerizing)